MEPKVKGNFVKVLIIKILFVAEKFEKKLGAVMTYDALWIYGAPKFSNVCSNIYYQFSACKGV